MRLLQRPSTGMIEGQEAVYLVSRIAHFFIYISAQVPARQPQGQATGIMRASLLYLFSIALMPTADFSQPLEFYRPLHTLRSCR